MAQTVYSPPVNTHTVIGSITLSDAADSVIFSGLDGYRDLILVTSLLYI